MPDWCSDVLYQSGFLLCGLHPRKNVNRPNRPCISRAQGLYYLQMNEVEVSLWH